MDVDFDFFDDPKDKNLQSKPPLNGGGKRKQDSEDSSDTDSSTDDYSSDTEDELPKKKIEARLPNMRLAEDDESDQSDRSNSGRRAPTPDEASTARSDPHTYSSGSDPGPSKMEPRVAKLKPKGLQSKTVGSRKRSESCSSNDSYKTVSDSTSDSDVTDVSPLNTPHVKYKVDFEDTAGRPCSSKPPASPARKSGRQPRPISAGSSSSKSPSSRIEKLLNANHDSVDMKLLLQAVMEMEQEQGYDARSRSARLSKPKPKIFKPVGPAPVPKKNYSFSNDSVRTIDMENQRLMQNILKYATATRKAKAKVKAQPKNEHKNQQAPTTAAINRKKEQLRIEAENQALLRRLQNTNATRTVQRDRLMNDYSKTMLFGYSVAAAHEDSLLKKKSPYEVPSSPLTGPHTRSASSMLSGSGKRSRPQSAVTYGPRAQTSGAGQKPRPHSATVRSGSASGKNYPVFKPVATTKPAWDDRW